MSRHSDLHLQIPPGFVRGGAIGAFQIEGAERFGSEPVDCVTRKRTLKVSAQSYRACPAPRLSAPSGGGA
jgi:hypothetical protein